MDLRPVVPWLILYSMTRTLGNCHPLCTLLGDPLLHPLLAALFMGSGKRYGRPRNYTFLIVVHNRDYPRANPTKDQRSEQSHESILGVVVPRSSFVIHQQPDAPGGINWDRCIRYLPKSKCSIYRYEDPPLDRTHPPTTNDNSTAVA